MPTPTRLCICLRNARLNDLQLWKVEALKKMIRTLKVASVKAQTNWVLKKISTALKKMKTILLSKWPSSFTTTHATKRTLTTTIISFQFRRNMISLLEIWLSKSSSTSLMRFSWTFGGDSEEQYSSRRLLWWSYSCSSSGYLFTTLDSTLFWVLLVCLWRSTLPTGKELS